MATGIFEIKEEFYLNGQAFKIISGAMHYFRIVPEYWRDRLEKLKAMGCNTVETYVPWNVHEPYKGQYHFEGMADLETFLQIAEELGLYVILRPSPYICAEWEFGGLPAWLLAEDGMKLRANYEPYLKHVREYYDMLFPKVIKYQVNHGGPIILMQIENEYGYYGMDTSYLEIIRDMMLERGVVVPLLTSDGPWDDAMACGKVEGILPTGNFGSHMKEQFENLKQHTDGGPLMCMEFWVGWFDYWGSRGHVISDLSQNIIDLREGIANGHLNIYMFIGGTNFGFMNGSNYYDELQADVTSYDYDAVLAEDGSITEKYKAFKKVIGEFVELPEVNLTMDVKRHAYGELVLKEKVGLFETLESIAQPVEHLWPQSMEKLGQSYGYTLYRSDLIKESKIKHLRLWDANDRAKIYLDEKPLLTLYDHELLTKHELNTPLEGNPSMSILMENMGRVNFGLRMEKQRKGIDGHVEINGMGHTGWTHYTLPLDNIDQVDYSKGYTEGNPAFYKFELDVEEACDTFLEMTGWGKGNVFINGFNLGRFWEIGPQKRLYLPGPLLKIGINEIVIFETEGVHNTSLQLMDEPDIGPNMMK